MTAIKVVFRKFSDGEVIALFPELAWDEHGNVTSYMHVGQHGAASRDIVQCTKPATPEEYSSLLEELKEIGYKDLKVSLKMRR